MVTATFPANHDLPGTGWTIRKIGQWCQKTLGKVASRGTWHALLHAAELSWKKCKKWLGKRDPEKRRAYLQQFDTLYQRQTDGEIALIYVDESHFHRDMDLGYSWGRLGERLWRVSGCAPLSDRINWFGAYNFTLGQSLIWAEGACNQTSTTAFLKRLTDWLRPNARQPIILWDGAPWHRAKSVVQSAADLNLEIVPLAAYSPDFNPIEGLWKWMREEVTQGICYPTMKALFEACKQFIDRINLDPLAMIQRLWPRCEIDPETEKLRFSG